MNPLPDGWVRTSLCNVGKLVSGAGFPERFQNKKGLRYPFFKVGNLGGVESGKPLLESDHTVDDVIARSLRASIIPRDAIVFAKIGMAIRLNRRRLIGLPSCIDNNLMAVIPSEAVLARYLLRFLETVDFMPLSQSTTVPALRKSDLDLLEIPLPPLNEQRRIVAKLENLLSRVNAAQERLATIPRILKRFRQSVLAAACSGRLTADWRESHPNGNAIEELRVHSIATANAPRNKRRTKAARGLNLVDYSGEFPDTWSWLKIRELVELGAMIDVQDGNHGELYPRKDDFGDVGVPYITAENVINDKVQIDAAPRLRREKATQLRIGFAKANDVILTHNATVGRVGLLPDCSPEVILSTSTTYYRTDSSVLLPSYLATYLRSHYFQRQLEAVMEQTTRNQVSVTKQVEFGIAFPPFAEQAAIVRRVQALFKTADALEARYHKAKAHVDKLTQSILAKAFRGELIPQNPNDEPAWMLLDRIRKQPYGSSTKTRQGNAKTSRTQTTSRSDNINRLNSASFKRPKND